MNLSNLVFKGNKFGRRATLIHLPLVENGRRKGKKGGKRKKNVREMERVEKERKM